MPVAFRGAAFNIPVAIWIPRAYPREAPLVYVTPTTEMAIRPGQHVSVEGMVYHPYLANWSSHWDVSWHTNQRHKQSTLLADMYFYAEI